MFFPPFVLFEDVRELQGVYSSVNPTFPVFMGTGTVSRRRGCRSTAASIESLAAAVQRAFASAVFDSVDLIFFAALTISFRPQMFSWRSDEVEVECSFLGISNSYTFCCSLSFLFCQKRVQVTPNADSDVPRRLRAPSPQRPTAHFPNTFR